MVRDRGSRWMQPIKDATKMGGDIVYESCARCGMIVWFWWTTASYERQERLMAQGWKQRLGYWVCDVCARRDGE